MARIGKLDQRIELFHDYGTLNDAREKEAVWKRYASIWAEDMSVRARESNNAEVMADQPEHVFKIRNGGTAATVSNNDRVRWASNGDINLIILGVSRMGPRQQYLQITARQLEPQEYNVQLLTEGGAPLLTEDGEDIHV